MNDQMSLYIPHVFPNFTASYIANTFEFMEIGKVDHVDLVAKMDKHGKLYNSAYIHFAYWFAGPIAENFQARVVDPEIDAHIVHDDPWYWIVLENTSKKYEPGARKECINISSEDEVDALIAELYNDPMDMSCEFDECSGGEIVRLRTENQLLHVTIKMHSKVISDLQLEIEHLKKVMAK